MIATTVNAGPRIDRLPLSGFHRRVLWLIGAGMFFDSFDIYLAGGVLGALLRSRAIRTMAINATFISMTFVGMIIGSFMAVASSATASAGASIFSFNLLLFGCILAAAPPPACSGWSSCRLHHGHRPRRRDRRRLCHAHRVRPPDHRGRWGALLSLITNSALFASTLTRLHRRCQRSGWRWMFAFVAVMLA